MKNSLNQTKNNIPDVSVIVPVYNSEKYLHQCLDSIIKQTLENIEIICIDDCSTDSSYKILKEYKRKDDRIILLRNKKTSGTSITCNKGLNLAKGKYLCFVKSDDWIEEENLEYTFNSADDNNLDLILYKSEIYEQETQTLKKTDRSSFSILRKFENKIFNFKNINPKILYLIPSNIENKLYSRDLIETNKIRFTDESADNILFFNECLLKSDRVTLLDEYLYKSRIYLESKVDSSIIDSKKDFNIFEGLINVLLSSTDLYNKFHEVLYNYIFTKFNEKLKQKNNNNRIDYYNDFKDFITRLITGYNLYYDIRDSLDYNNLESFNLILKSINDSRKEIVDIQTITRTSPNVSVLIDSSKKSDKQLKNILESLLIQDMNFQFLEVYFIDNYQEHESTLKEFKEEFYNVHVIKLDTINQKISFMDFIKTIPTDYLLIINEIIRQDFIKSLYDNKYSNNLISCLPSQEIYEDKSQTNLKLKDSLLLLENKLLKISYIEDIDPLKEDENGNIILKTKFYTNSFFSDENITKYINHQLENYLIDDYNLIVEVLKINFYNKLPADKIRVFENIKRFFNKWIQYEDYDKIIANLNNSNKSFFDIVIMSIKDDNSNIKTIQDRIKLDIPVSILIYVENNPVNELDNIINSIIRQNLEFSHLEIVLLNNNSENSKTLFRLGEFAKTYYNIKLVSSDKQLSMNEVYNLGLDSNDKQYLMFTNKDHIFLNNSVKNMFKSIRNNNMNLATGNIQNNKTYLPVENIYTKIIKKKFIDENNIRFYCKDDAVVIDPKILHLNGIIKVDIPVIKQ